MEKLDEKCAVLITSCDKYEDAWYPFFTLFSIMWDNCPYQIILNTETKSYTHQNLNITTLHPTNLYKKKNKPISWSERLRQVLNQIEQPYIIFMLEDFFLLSKVRSNVITDCINWMDKEANVGCINFYNDPYNTDTNTREVKQIEFAPINPEYDFGINTMSALWRKEYLLDILRDENPWDFEFFATRRAKKMPYACYSHIKDFSPVFDYSIQVENGYGIYQGKWLKNNQILFDKHGIKVDFEERGVIDPELFVEREHERNWIINRFKNLLKHPSLLKHYLMCAKNVFRVKKRKFKAKFFNK